MMLNRNLLLAVQAKYFADHVPEDMIAAPRETSCFQQVITILLPMQTNRDHQICGEIVCKMTL